MLCLNCKNSPRLNAENSISENITNKKVSKHLNLRKHIKMSLISNDKSVINKNNIIGKVRLKLYKRILKIKQTTVRYQTSLKDLLTANIFQRL